MWTQFLLENAHFALNVFGGLAFFSVFWLYFDAWSVKKNPKEVVKIVGFGLLSLSFLVHATVVESNILTMTIFKGDINHIVATTLRNLGYLFVAVGILSEGIQPYPTGKLSAFLPFGISDWKAAIFLQPVLAAFAGFTYLRRATVGLENHLKRVALAFFILSFSEVLGLAGLLANTTNIDIYKLVAPFGLFWIIEHVILAISLGIFASWGFSYLLKRIQTQLFIIFTSVILVIFLVTTVSFTALLLKNIQDETLSTLSSNAKVLSLGLDTKKGESVSNGLVLASDPKVAEMIEAGEKGALGETVERFLLTKKQSTLLILDAGGVVLARGEDRERIGESFSDDPVVKRALAGAEASSVITKDGVLSPEVHIRAAVPIKTGEEVVGVVVAGSLVDNAFLDGIKKATGFEASIYGGDALSATSIVSFGGAGRPLGIKEGKNQVKEVVLTRGEQYLGGVTLLNSDYFASYLPLKDVDEVPVGMLFVGKPQTGVLSTAGRSIEVTFVVTASLLILSIFPSYWVSKYLADQI